ncbi:MAG: dihydrofolate reductase [Vezdaea aestivalis]|nr:MAG: dihydrofolate reductase [Vezdaea aestivalis]
MASSRNLPLTLIVATSKSGGIGSNGALPWPMIKGEMGYFSRVTKRLAVQSESSQNDSGRQNAVIMGRTTYLSIPPRFRPLPGRLNVILSRRGFEVPQGVIVAGNLEQAMEQLQAVEENKKLGRVFVIGGEETYKASLEGGAHRILCTRVEKIDGGEWDCDRWFPLKLWDQITTSIEGQKEHGGSENWTKCSAAALNAWVGESIANEKVEGEGQQGVRWEVGMWTRSGF